MDGPRPPVHGDPLERSEASFRLLVESVRDYAIFMLDPQGRVASWNLGAERIKGYKADEIIGKSFSVFYTHEALARGWPDHELLVASREGRFEDEGWRVRKDGTRFWANVVITALIDDAGRLRGFAKVTRDLTERVKLETAEEAGRQTAQFLAMLGHELRNPLAPIRNAVEVLRLRGSTSADPTLAWARDMIDRQVTHMGRLVDDLLDVSRVTLGKVTVAQEPVDLKALVESVVDSVRADLDARRHALTVELPGLPVVVRGDATRLAQVVSNLLTNAGKYTPEGGQIAVILEREDGYVHLRVLDNGLGIGADLMPRLFEPFVQGERSLDRAEGGLGLGLTLVRRLVELHMGTVSAYSEGPGQGSEFLVRLPRLQGDVVPSPQREPAAARPGRRVLVVDDSRDSAESLSLLLSVWGHGVKTAFDGPAALAAAANWDPDVVLLDLGLPGMSGYEVAERLAKTPDPPVLIAVTGYGQSEDRARTRAAGFSTHLVKPLDPRALEELLGKVPPRA